MNRAAVSLAALDVSPTCRDGLQRYAEMVRRWNPRINLVAASTLADFERRHIIDCFQIFSYIPARTQEILDVGSGAGLPGIVLALACPQKKFVLAERVQKKSSFLLTAVHELGLKNVSVHAGDLRTLAPRRFEVITARALAPLVELLPLTAPLLAPGGRWLLLKGEAAQQEINALENSPQAAAGLTIERHTSIVNPAGSVLVVKSQG
jgi:16S rRNA (guanine527-N7)-methyltransferase